MMLSGRTPGALAAAILLVTAAAPANALLSTDRTLAPQAVTSATPKPPHVTTRPTKDGVQTGAQGKVDGRLTDSRPPKKANPPPRKQIKDSGSPDPRRTKDNPPINVPERVDLRVNTGICGLREPDGSFPGPMRCQPVGSDPTLLTRQTLPPAVVQPQPEDVTWAQILAESKVVLFPRLSVKVQPKDRTLVNLETIVYTDESTVSTSTVTLLGFPVVVEATPMSYRWSFGDGTSPLQTTTPGKPYPSKEITHKYLKRGAVNLSVTTNYAARFNVAGTGWQYVDGTIPVTGPATPLQVREAVPVLVGPGG